MFNKGFTRDSGFGLENGHSEKNRSNVDLPSRALQEPLTAPNDWQPNGSTKGFRLSPKSIWTFLRPALFTRDRGPPKPLRSTAYLDGLRGFAALMVYLGHHHSWAHEHFSQGLVAENGFGFSNNYYLAALPFLRMFVSGGHYAVCIFFIISGYVLSAKPLALITSGDLHKLSENVGSALFRRWLRLYIPVICTTLTFATIQHAFDIWISWPKRQSTYLGELVTWYLEFKQYSFIYRGGGDPWLTYNFHSWSIPIEFKGSIVIYTVLIALARASVKARLLCEIFLMYYFMIIVDGWFCALFMAGMFLCDVEMLAKAKTLPDWRIIGWCRPYKEFIFHNFLIFGIYLGGIPHVNKDILVLRTTPGWYYLSLLKPQAVYDYKWFYLFWAALLTVSAINNLGWLRRFFESRFNVYLGRISFSFYLVHGPVMWGLGDRLYAAVGFQRELHMKGIPHWVDAFPIPALGPFGYELNYFATHLILFPLTLWLSEIATKIFDEPSLKFSQWLYKKTLASS